MVHVSETYVRLGIAWYLVALVGVGTWAAVGSWTILPALALMGVAAYLRQGMPGQATWRSYIPTRLFLYAALALLVLPMDWRGMASDHWLALALCGLAVLECLLVGGLRVTRAGLELVVALVAVHLVLLSFLPPALHHMPLAMLCGASLILLGLRLEAGFFPFPQAPGAIRTHRMNRLRQYLPSTAMVRRLAGARVWLPLSFSMIAGGLLLFLFVPRGRLDVEGWIGRHAPRARPRQSGMGNPGLPGDGPSASPANVVDFSEYAPLGIHGDLYEDDTVIMRVALSTPAGRPIPLQTKVRMRGMIFDAYEDGVWFRKGRDRRLGGAANDRAGRGNGWLKAPLPVGTSPEELGQGAPILQSVELELVASEAIFAMPEPVGVRAPERYMALRADQHGNLRFPTTPRVGTTYSVISRELRPDPLAVRRVFRPRAPRSMAPYLALPMGDPRFRALARRIRTLLADEVLVGREEATRIYRCRRIETWLKSQYGYNLRLRSTPGSEPLEEFLFDRRSGCCMHFAAAMVVMLRLDGIPARMASGFVSSDRDLSANRFLVRKRDAHAWVEVWFPRVGWMTFDPTPPRQQGPTEPARAATETTASWSLGGAVRRLMHWAHGYDEQSRADIQSFLLEGLRRLLRPFWLLILIASVAAYLLLRRRLGRNRQAGARGGGQGGAPRIDEARMERFYETFLATLKRRGLEIRPQDTPLDLADRAREILPAEAVMRLTLAFCEWRYGGRAPAPSMRGVIEADLAALRGHRPRPR